MGPEKALVKLRVYLGTLSRLLPEILRSQGLCDLSEFSSGYVATHVRDVKPPGIVKQLPCERP